MRASKRISVVFLLLGALFGGALQAAEEEGVMDRTGRVIHKGAQATARGIEKGVEATGRGVNKGVEATGRVFQKAGNWIDGKLNQGGAKRASPPAQPGNQSP